MPRTWNKAMRRMEKTFPPRLRPPPMVNEDVSRVILSALHNSFAAPRRSLEAARAEEQDLPKFEDNPKDEEGEPKILDFEEGV